MLFVVVCTVFLVPETPAHGRYSINVYWVNGGIDEDTVKSKDFSPLSYMLIPIPHFSVLSMVTVYP